jgi:7-cyano-7-deazaguanine synthase
MMDREPGKNDACLVVFSGGQDSTTCLYWARERFREVHAVTFDYGQKHRIEIESAIKIAALAGCTSHEVICVSGTLASTSPLVDMSHDVGQYGSVQDLPGGLEATFVPSRNIFFLTIASNRAYVKGIKDLIVGVSAVDYGGYPDCRPEFIRAMETALQLGMGARMTIHAPVISMGKKETVLFAAQLPGCMEALAWSHTCYKGEFPPCGKCHACLLREKGFQEAGIEDPLVKPRFKVQGSRITTEVQG